jgi:hypothetical protein
MLCHANLGQAMLSPVMSDSVCLDYVRPCYVRLVQVSSGQDRLGHFSPC